MIEPKTQPHGGRNYRPRKKKTMFEQQWNVAEYLERFPCAFDRI